MSSDMWEIDMLSLPCKKLHEQAKLPVRKAGELGWDFSVVPDDSFRELPIDGCGPNCTEYINTIALMPGESHLFHLGIAAAIPDGYGMILFDRSGMGAKKLIHRFAGVIDSTYRGEWLVLLKNFSNGVQRINVGDRIIQGVLVRNYDLEPFWTEELDDTERGASGFGSSGR